jgi:hypothetical protein
MEEETYSRCVLLRLRLHVCLVETYIFLNVGESIDFEQVLGVKWMVVEGC